jgi:putative SOS response-associated peptidase YedK
MCGRFVRSFTIDELIQEINEAVPAVHVMRGDDDAISSPHFNQPPSLPIPVVRFDRDHLVLEQMTWGFDMGGSSQLVINARSESVVDKPMFRNLVTSHRCAVPMDGFYEWHREGSRKTPFYVSRDDNQRMWVAGVWRRSQEKSQVVLLTNDATGVLHTIHHRSPCQITIDDALSWTADSQPHLELLNPGTGPMLRAHRVSKDVNSIRNNRNDLVAEIDDEEDDAQMNLFD